MDGLCGGLTARPLDIWQLVSQMLLKSNIWWQARTNQDQSVGPWDWTRLSANPPLSCRVSFHFSPFSRALPRSRFSFLASFVIPPSLAAVLPLSPHLQRGNQALLWVFKHWSRQMLNYSRDLIFCLLGGRASLHATCWVMVVHAWVRCREARADTHTQSVSESESCQSSRSHADRVTGTRVIGPDRLLSPSPLIRRRPYCAHNTHTLKKQQTGARQRPTVISSSIISQTHKLQLSLSKLHKLTNKEEQEV